MSRPRRLSRLKVAHLAHHIEHAQAEAERAQRGVDHLYTLLHTVQDQQMTALEIMRGLQENIEALRPPMPPAGSEWN
jgi:hypothetical protein